MTLGADFVMAVSMLVYFLRKRSSLDAYKRALDTDPDPADDDRLHRRRVPHLAVKKQVDGEDRFKSTIENDAKKAIGSSQATADDGTHSADSKKDRDGTGLTVIVPLQPGR